MKLKPLGDRVVLKYQETEEKTPAAAGNLEAEY